MKQINFVMLQFALMCIALICCLTWFCNVHNLTLLIVALGFNVASQVVDLIQEIKFGK